jgi:nitroreductase
MKAFKVSRRLLIAGGIGFTANVVGVGTTVARAAEGALVLPDVGGQGPWEYWGSNEGVGMVRIAAAAILSASPYNTQPWLFRIGDNRIEVLADSERNLGNLDGLRREFYMGLGCAIENACVASPLQGRVPSVRLLPEPSNGNIAAIIEFQPIETNRHPHYDAIALRHTHRGAYRLDRRVEEDVLNALAGQVSSPETKILFCSANSSDGQRFTDMMMAATRRILDVDDLREGRHAGLRSTMSDPSAADTQALRKADAGWLESTHTIACATASAYGIIMVRGSRRDHRLHMEAGRLWQRIHLEGTSRGLAMQPMNHFIEIIDYETVNQGRSPTADRLQLSADWTGWQPIFGFRLGYADAAAPRSSRRPLSSVVVS